LGNFTVNSKELDFLMQAVCFLWGGKWLLILSFGSSNLKICQLPHWTRFVTNLDLSLRPEIHCSFWNRSGVLRNLWPIVQLNDAS
jgi:hypothetical protein